LAATLSISIHAQNCSPTYPPLVGSGIVPDDNSERVERVSLDGLSQEIDSTYDPSGTPCGGPKGSSHPWISDDGDRIVFSAAPRTMPGLESFSNPDQKPHIFLRVVSTSSTYLISGKAAASGGLGMKDIADNAHDFARISGDGEWIAWTTSSTDLPGAPGNGVGHVYLHDVDAQLTFPISVAVAGPNQGQAGNGSSKLPFLSEDGRYVAFQSRATNLHDQILPAIGWTGYVPEGGCPTILPEADTWDVFVLDRGDGATEPASIVWASIGAAGQCSFPPDDASGLDPAKLGCQRPTISADACFVTFESRARNLTQEGNPTNDLQCFLRDMATGETFLLSKTMGGVPAATSSARPMVSRDGEWVVFESASNLLVPFDTNGHPDTFVWERQTGQLTRVTIDSAGNQIMDNFRGVQYPFISANGRFVYFTWGGPSFNGDGTGFDLSGNPTHNETELYVHDRDYDDDGDYDAGPNGTYETDEVRTIRVSDLPAATPTSGGSNWSGGNACASADGRYVVYMSRANDFVDAIDLGGVDTNGDTNCDTTTGGCGTKTPNCPGNWGRDIFRREMYVTGGGQ